MVINWFRFWQYACKADQKTMDKAIRRHKAGKPYTKKQLETARHHNLELPCKS